MFSGLVEAVARIEVVEQRDRDCSLRLQLEGERVRDLCTGESIAVDGACLTVTAADEQGFRVDVSAETLAHTTLGSRGAGDRVNLERALLPTTRLGGHLVSGHIDGVGEVTSIAPDGVSRRLKIRVPARLARYVAPKGSICVDGVSLTVNEVEGNEFGVNIVPHTLAQTTLGDLATGRAVNLEVDLIARYLERLLAARDTADEAVTREMLARTGFIPE